MPNQTSTSDGRRHSMMLINQGLALFRRDAIEAAMSAFMNAIVSAQAAGFDDGELQARLSLGACHLDSGLPGHAKEEFERALKLAEALNDLVGQRKCWLNLGNCFSASDEALPCFLKSLRLAEEIGDDLGMGQALDQIALFHKARGDLRVASHFNFRALAAFERAGNPVSYGLAMRNAGAIASELSSTDAAVESSFLQERASSAFNTALSIARSTGNRTLEASSLNGLALLARNRGEYAVAETSLREAMSVLAGVRSTEVTTTQLHLASVLALSKRFPDALTLYRDVARQKRDAEDEVGLARACVGAGTMLNTLARYRQALRYLRLALPKFDLLQVGLAEEPTAGFLDQAAIVWLETLFSLFQLARQAPDRKISNEIVALLEKRKARLLSYDQGAPVLSSPESGERLEREITIRREILKSRRDRRRLRALHDFELVSADDLDSEMNAVVAKGHSAIAQLAEIRRHWKPSPKGATLAATEGDGGHGDGLATAYVVDLGQRERIGMVYLFENHVSVASVNFRQEEATRLFNALDFVRRTRVDSQEDADRLEDFLGLISTDLGELVQRLNLWEHVAKHEPKSLLMIPQGRWHHLPWEIACSSQRFLGIEVSITRLHSLGVLRAVHARRPVGDPPQRALVVCPTPDELPGTKREARDVAAVLSAKGFDVACPSAPLVKAVVMDQLNSRRLGIIHFAGHCVFNSEDASLSAIMLGASKADGEAHDEIVALELGSSVAFPSSPLVYLSSCESSQTRVGPADEPFGLLRGLLRAGARSIIATNWPVFDESGPDIAKAFYEGICQGKAPNDALRQARRSVREKAGSGAYNIRGELLHWAPYVHYGDPSNTA